MQTKVNNIDINYIDNKDDFDDLSNIDTIVLLHGWGANINTFIYLVNVLKPYFRVVALDMPGFGASKEPKEAMDVGEYTEFVIDFLKVLDVKKAHFLGHSFGGRVIIKMNNRKNLPFTMEKIALVDAAGIKPKQKLSTKIRVRCFKLAKKLFSIPVMEKMYPNFIENMRNKLGSADYNAASPVMRSSLVKVVNEDLSDLIKNIKNETLLVWGENDDATPLSDGKYMEKHIKNSALIVVKGAGHYSFLDNPGLVNSAILSFFGGQNDN